jgi:hypothetical protein
VNISSFGGCSQGTGGFAKNEFDEKSFDDKVENINKIHEIVSVILDFMGI